MGKVHNKSTGYRSTGYRSTGYRSTGNCSTGHWSTGYRSTGNYSTGDWSTGNHSTGNYSTGNYSTGEWSTGNWSTGNWSTGNCSTGHWSTGNCSTGDWSTGNHSTGHFCTKDGRGFGAFNKKIHKDYKTARTIWDAAEKPPCLFFKMTVWVDSKDMTEQEKINNPKYASTLGYLKVLDYKSAFSASVLAAPKKERDMIRALPNFDAEVFLEISGVDLRLVD